MEGFLNPNEILEKLELREDMAAVDFGSGSGGWVIPLAKILKEGKVYAIDILEEPLSVLKGRAQIEKILNITTIRANIESEEGLKLADNSCDLVLITNLLFQIEEKEKVFSQAKRILKPGAKILVVDWKADSPLGPKEGRVLAEDVKKLAKKFNFAVKKEFPAGAYHWGLILSNSK